MGTWIIGLATILLVVGKGQSDDPRTPDELLKTDLQVFVQWLDRARPAPLLAGERARLLSTVTPTDELRRLNESGQRKLAAVRRLLQAIGRAAEYETKVVDTPLFRVAVFERAVILISEPAITSLKAEELQALAAHEIGHEYFIADYERASAVRDNRRLKDVELMCDAVALVTLERLHINPSRLMSAVKKSTSYNRLHFSDAMDERPYPTLSERGAFAREVTAWIARGRGNVSASPLEPAGAQPLTEALGFLQRDTDSIFIVKGSRAELSGPTGQDAPNKTARVDPWPCHILTSETMRRLFREAWERSPTIRHQCDELHTAQALVQLDWGSSDSLSHAKTAMTTRGGVVFAHVAIPPVDDTIPRLAHELQHVIEYTRGIDFETESKRPHSGVSRTYFGYETQGAIDVGRQVANELRDRRRASR